MIATVGTFDGLHRGHMAIIGALLAEAAATGEAPCLISFTDHPLAVIAPERCPARLMPRQRLAADLKALGISEVHLLQFTPELAALTAAQFLGMLRRDYGVDTLVMGFDNTFGSDRLTSRADYAAAAAAQGIRIVTVPAVLTADGRKISSSLLRHALADADIPLARECLGRWPEISGTVVHGKKNGRRLGFPTLNINPDHYYPYVTGVYAATLLHDGKQLPGVLSIGHNPTIAASNPLTIELHVPDHDLGDMYGRHVTVALRQFIRQERRFSTLADLTDAIAADIARMRTII